MIRQIILCLIVLFLSVNVAPAQGGRRPVRVPATSPPGPVLPIGPREPLVQGDGRLLERISNLVNTVTARGTNLKSVAVVAATNLDEFKRTAQTVEEKFRNNKGNTEESAFLKKVLETVEWFAVDGFDSQQPFGYIMQTDGMTLYPIYFMSLDWKSRGGQTVLNRIGQQLPDGRYIARQDIFPWPPGNLYIHQRNGWTFITTEFQLQTLPDDPTVFLQGLDKKSLVTARFDFYNMPQLATNIGFSIAKANTVARAENEFDKAGIRLWLEHLWVLSEQIDFLELTLFYDEQKNDFVFEQREFVRPNTERQRLLHQRSNIVSPFHGFYRPDRAIYAAHVAQPLTESQYDNLKIILDETLGKVLLTEEVRQTWKQITQWQQPAQPPQPERPARWNRPNRGPAVVAPPTPVAEPDASTKLAELLARVPLESAEESPPKPTSDWPDAKQVEAIVRQIAVCYYSALLGAIRNEYFDGAMTISISDGFLGAYGVAEGQEIRKVFDAVTATLAEQFPKVYAERVRKDYAEVEGFRLTDVALRLDDLFPDAWWMQFVPEYVRQQPGIRIVFGIHNNALCIAVGPSSLTEQRLRTALNETAKPQRVDDQFLIFSAYELGQAIGDSNRLDRLSDLRAILADANPATKASAVTTFTNTSKTQTLRVSGFLAPSLWQMREYLRTTTGSRQ